MNSTRLSCISRGELIALFFATVIFFATSIISPPRLMDDVDAVQAQIAHNSAAVRRLGDPLIFATA